MNEKDTVERLAQEMNTEPEQLPLVIAKLKREIAETEREIKRLKRDLK